MLPGGDGGALHGPAGPAPGPDRDPGGAAGGDPMCPGNAEARIRDSAGRQVPAGV